MPEIPAPPDDAQQDPRERNRGLADLLNGAWNDKNIARIRREPPPTEPPDPNGPKKGKWIAQTA